MKNNFGRRVIRHGLVLTTALTCTALQAEQKDQDYKSSQQTSASQSQSQSQIGGAAQSERGSATQGRLGSTSSAAQGEHGKAEKFVQKALMSGQMEVEMGRLAQQKGQSQEVKSLGQALVRDHTDANQRLQQLASSKNITVSKTDPGSSSQTSTAQPSSQTDRQDANRVHAAGEQHDKQMKAQEHMSKLRNLSGQEFDKTFVQLALKHHKKDIAEFEKCRTDVNDPELRAFIDQTLPKLRQHLQMAQSAAPKVGVDEATLSSDFDDDQDSAIGSPASGTTGTRGSDKQSSPASKDRSSLDQTDRSAAIGSSTIDNNAPRADLDANVGDRSVSATADLDRDNNQTVVDVDDDGETKIFQKGDGKVLGLPTDKNDGKFLGIIPNPNANNDDADAEIEVDVDTDNESVGGAASSETGSRIEK